MFTVAIENLDEFMASWRGAVGQLVLGTQAGLAAGLRAGIQEALAARRWRDRTGQTKDALQGYVDVRNANGAEGWLECKVPWASYLADGTEPHDIHPKAPFGTPTSRLRKGQTVRASGPGPHEHIVGRGTFLRWKDEANDEHFARVVHHPGTQPDDFWTRGQAACERTIKHEVEAAVPAIQRRWLDP
jgi:hypothetical protein